MLGRQISSRIEGLSRGGRQNGSEFTSEILTDGQDDRNDYRAPETDSTKKNNDLIVERDGGEERINGDPEAHNQHGSYDSDPSDDRPTAKESCQKAYIIEK